MIAVLLVIGFVGAYWKILCVIALVAVAARAASRFIARAEARRQADLTRERAIIARADQQHRWVAEGDDRGVYGIAWPTVRTYRELGGSAE